MNECSNSGSRFLPYSCDLEDCTTTRSTQDTPEWRGSGTGKVREASGARVWWLEQLEGYWGALWLDSRVEIQGRMRQEAHDPNGERTRLPRFTAIRASRVKWQPKGGPKGNRCRMVMDEGNSWATKTRIGGIQGRQCGWPRGFRGHNVVDHEDQVRAGTDRRGKGPHKCRPRGWIFLQARTREVKAKANADLEGEDPGKHGPEE